MPIASTLAHAVRSGRRGLDRWTRELAPARWLRLALALRALERRAELGRILDAGCQDGMLAARLGRRHSGWRIHGVDLDPDALARAGARTGSLPNVSFGIADLTADRLPGPFDIAVALECLAEIPDDDAALATLARALRPGGELVVHVPHADWRPVLRSSPREWHAAVRHGYRPEQLAEKLRAAGFVVRTVTPSTHGLVQLAQELRDRTKHRGFALRLLVQPLLALSVPAELAGLRLGAPRALLVEAERVA